MRLAGASPFLLLVLAGCSFFKAPHAATAPIVYRGASANNVARITVTAVNAMPWQEIKTDLSNARLTLNQDALNLSSFATSADARTTTDMSTASLAATLALPGSAGSVSTPTAPSQLSPTTVGIPVQATSGTFTPNVDIATRIRMEAALSEGVVEINRRYDSVPIQPGYVPYFVDLLVSIDPLNRRQPYDTTITMDFCHNPAGNSLESNVNCPGTKKIFVIPLESSEALEGEQEAVASNFARQISLQVGVAAHSVAINAGLQKILDDIASQQYLNLNSLSLPVQNGSNGLAVRFGANQVGNHFEMEAKTHSVTLILLVPREYVQPGSKEFEVAIKGKAYFRDPDVPEDAPINRTSKNTDIQFTVFPLDLTEVAACPPSQSIVANTSAAATVVAPASAAQALTVLTVNGAASLQYRRVRANFVTKYKSKSIDILAPEAIHTADSLVFTFPDLSGIASQESALSLTVLATNSGDQPSINCSGEESIYPVIFPASRKVGVVKKVVQSAAVPNGTAQTAGAIAKAAAATN